MSEFNKETLAKEIGNFFGEYFEENGTLCVESGLETLQYDTPDDFLSDWVDTLVEHQYSTPNDPSSNWEDEIIFIYSEVIGKWPTGIRPSVGINNTTWQASINVTVPGETPVRGKDLFIGTYMSIVDAIGKRNEFLTFYKKQTSPNLSELAEKAKNMRIAAKENLKKAKRLSSLDEQIKSANNQKSVLDPNKDTTVKAKER